MVVLLMSFGADPSLRDGEGKLELNKTRMTFFPENLLTKIIIF